MIPNQSARIVFLCTDSRASRAVFHALHARFGVCRVIVERPVPRRRLVARRTRRLGVRKVIGQAAFQALVQPVLTRIAEPRVAEILHGAGLTDCQIPEHLVDRVTSVNDESSIKTLLKLDPKLVFINGTRILAKSFLAKVQVPVVNIHAGITPTYRGVHGAYWALVEGDTQRCGVTVHLVDPGIDTGVILARRVIRPTAEDSFATYPYLQLAAGVPAAMDVVQKLIDGPIEPFSPEPSAASKLWHHPTIWQYACNRWRRGVA